MHRSELGRAVTNELANREHCAHVTFVELGIWALDAFVKPERAIEARRQNSSELRRAAHVEQEIAMPQRKQTMHRFAERRQR